MSSKALLCTWCSSAKREGFNHITQKTTSITVSLTRITAHSIITNFVRVTHLYIVECYETLNSHFALEHRYALGVLIKKPSESELVDALPFLIGSLGTICFDLVILMQHFYYEYYYNKNSNRPGYLMRFDTQAREHLPHGIHNIVDPMASPFFPRTKRILTCSDVSPSNLNEAHRRNSN